MNFSCDRTLLYEAMLMVSRSIPQKTAIPVLSCFLIEARQDGEIIVTGYDLDLGITSKISGDVLMSGKIAVDAKVSLEMMRNMDIGTVSFITGDKNTVNVFGGKSEYTISYADGETYPERPLIQGFSYLTFDQRVLYSIIKQTVFAVSENDVKGIYTGANFKFADGILEVVCTDTYRFAMRREKFAVENDFSIIIQGRVLSELIKIMKNEDGEVSVGYTDKHVVFEFENTRVISRLVEGTYMDYSRIMPKSFRYEVRVNAKDFRKVIERASVLMEEKKKMPIRLSLEKERIFFSFRNGTGHSFEDELPAEIGGEFLEIGLNNKNILDVLNVIEDEEIRLCFNTSLSSVCVLPKEGDSFLYLIAPMRLK